MRTEIVCEIANGRFESCLCDAHDIVILDDTFAAKVGERDDGGLPALHQRHCRSRDGNQRICADVERGLEVVTFCIGVHPVKRFSRGECESMHEKVEMADLLADSSHCRCDLVVARDVALDQQRIFQ